MRHLVLLALFFAACNGNGSGNPDDPEDREDPTGDGKITIDIGTAEGFETPLYVAVNYGDGWVQVSVSEDRTEVEVPKDATTFEAVTVCEGPWEGTTEVFWYDALVTLDPEPQLNCPNPADEDLDFFAGTGTGTYDLVEVSLGDGFDTFFPYSGESFEIAVRSGTYDLVAVPRGAAAPAGIVAFPSIASHESMTQALDFSTAAAPRTARVVFDGGEAPTYTEISGHTAGGTTFFAGHDDVFLPAASTGVDTDTLVAQVDFANGSQTWMLLDTADEVTVAAEPAEPIEATATVANGVTTIQAADADILHVQGWAVGASGYEETRIVFTRVGGSALGVWTIDPSTLPGFPASASGAPGEDLVGWGSSPDVSDALMGPMSRFSRDPRASTVGRFKTDEANPPVPADLREEAMAAMRRGYRMREIAFRE